MGGPGLGADDSHDADRRRLGAVFAVGHPTLALGDVDVFGHRLTVALDHDRNGAVQLLHRGGHFGEVGHRGVADLDHDVAGRIPAVAAGPSPVHFPKSPCLISPAAQAV